MLVFNSLNPICAQLFVMETSIIREFYNDRHVLVTGATGFIGKLLVEKLLRDTNVAKIYLLIREKKGVKIEDRFDKYLNDVIFTKLRGSDATAINFKNRLEPISGDCSEESLAISIEDRRKLISNVNIVFHVAATVNFNENIKTAFAINVNGVEQILKLCREMKNLKSIIHVSTAYCNWHLKHRVIEEKFYYYPINYKTIKKMLEESTSKHDEDAITEKFMAPWPNTYTFTKALSESLIEESAEDLPIGIFRPGIVISTNSDPIPGWIDNNYGPSNVCIGTWYGILKVQRCDGNLYINLVPGDFCVAAMIAAAWEVASKREIIRNCKRIRIYNYTSSPDTGALTYQQFIQCFINKMKKYPTMTSSWSICLLLVKNRTIYYILRFILHTIPATLIDIISILTVKKAKMLATYRKLYFYSDIVTPFALTDSIYKSSNVRKLWSKMSRADRKLFRFDITSIEWDQYVDDYIKGIRVYLLKDQLTSLAKAKARQRNIDTVKSILKSGVVLLIAFQVASWYYSTRIISA